ncbi:hypothetical protein F8S13_01885 [Chloroflexia bacterium SDU3-3]|nr:hypothetical protein F8S13_01885 [Chloroflexia bacterium SDU3-3]
MKAIISRLVSANRIILTNASSLISSTLIASALGFAYWWLAARFFSQHAVGVASASVSAMQLFGSLGVMGLSTLLISELPQSAEEAPSLICTALCVAGAASFALGLGFSVVAPLVAPDLGDLATPSHSLQFAAGVSLTAMNTVLDQATIGLLRGHLQLWRNAFFAVAKLVILYAAAMFVSLRTGMGIYTSWTLASLLSFLFLLWFSRRIISTGDAFRPRWGLLRRLGRAALSHHALNITLQGPRLLLPLIVTAMLSAATNAHFYVALMIANFIYMVPISLTTVLHAVGMAQREALIQRLRSTFAMSLAAGLGANLVTLVAADWMLRIFGHSYAEEARACLQILALAVFPIIIRYHYVSLARIHGFVLSAALWLTIGGLLELGMAAAGAAMGGLSGLSWGWLLAMALQAAAMFPALYRLALGQIVRQLLRRDAMPAVPTSAE